jgi:hypothetical protein
LELIPEKAEFQPYYQRISDQLQLKHQIAAINFTDPDHTEYGMKFLSTLLNEFLCQD